MEPKPTFIKEGSNFNLFESNEKSLICLPLEETLDEAANLMKENHIGDVIIVDERGGKIIPVGIVTDRDIALQAETKDLTECKISEFVSDSLITVKIGTDPIEMVKVMKENGITRLPLVNVDGTLAGIVTARNLLKVLVQALSDLTKISERQIRNEETGHH